MTSVVLCIVWALWPIIALAGGQGLPVLLALAALLALPGALKSLRPRWYMAALLAFFVFAGISTIWSPRSAPLVDFDFGTMKFAVRSEMLRVGLLFAAVGVLMAAANQFQQAGRRRLAMFANVAMLVQLAVLIPLVLLEEQALRLFSGLMSDSGEGIQNISRNTLIMAVAAPALAIGLGHSRSTPVVLAIALFVCGLVAALAYIRGVNASLLALAAAAACVAIVMLLPRHGFKVIGVLVATLLMVSPWLFAFLTQGADFATADDSNSYRAAIWQRVTDLINEDPIRGHGLGVLRTIEDTIETGVFAGHLMVPNHPHNMALQIWAELGAIGAGLLSVAIMLAGWRMPPADRMGRPAWRAAALAGSMAGVSFVSFDLWNEWWWAVAGLLAILAVAAPASGGREAAPGVAAPRGAGVPPGVPQ